MVSKTAAQQGRHDRGHDDDGNRYMTHSHNCVRIASELQGYHQPTKSNRQRNSDHDTTDRAANHIFMSKNLNGHGRASVVDVHYLPRCPTAVKIGLTLLPAAALAITRCLDNSLRTSPAGLGLLKKYPCASVQPSRFKYSSSSCVSTPSHAAVIPRLLPSPKTARMIAFEPALEARSCRNDWSILILSNGKLRR